MITIAIVMTALFAMHAIHQQSIQRDGDDSGADVTEYGNSAVGATRVELQCRVRNAEELVRDQKQAVFSGAITV